MWWLLDWFSFVLKIFTRLQKWAYLNTETESIAFRLMLEIEDPGQMISSPEKRRISMRLCHKMVRELKFTIGDIMIYRLVGCMFKWLDNTCSIAWHVIIHVTRRRLRRSVRRATTHFTWRNIPSDTSWIHVYHVSWSQYKCSICKR